MSSSASTFHFPLYNLNKVCFLTVAEQLDNTGRRNLSQTCQRFRRLLVPEDRYSNPPKSSWEVISVDNPFSFAQHHRKVPNSLETRHVCSLEVSDSVLTQTFHIGLSVADLKRSIFVNGQEDLLQPTDGVHLDFRKFIIGRLPAVLYETLHDLSKYIVVEHLHIRIQQDSSIRLPLILSSSFMFQPIPIVVLCMMSLYKTNLTGDSIETMINDFRHGMPQRARLQFYDGLQPALRTLRKLKTLIQKNNSDIPWKPTDQLKYAVELGKENGETVVYFEKEYAEELP